MQLSTRILKNGIRQLLVFVSRIYWNLVKATIIYLMAFRVTLTSLGIC